MIRFHLIAAFVLMVFLSSCSNQGESIPDFNLTTLDGITISTSDTKGKVLVVNVWATWCGSCIKEMPALNRLVEDFKDNSEVIFLAITDESETKTKASLERFPFKYQQVADAENYTSKLQTRFVKTYPQNLVINRNGVISYEVSDESGDIYTALKEAIEAAL